MNAPRHVGCSVPRREARRLLLGKARFIADLQLPGLLEVAFVRSSLGHAHIAAIRTDQALRSRGVVAIFTAADLDTLMRPIAGMHRKRGVKRSRTNSTFQTSLFSRPTRYAMSASRLLR
jgi:CO/xanthine dehydrogenase Mo-binding subunit